MDTMKVIVFAAFFVASAACGVDSSIQVTGDEFEASGANEQQLGKEARRCCCKSTFENGNGGWTNHVMCGYWNYDVNYSSQSEAENKCRENNARNGCAAVE